MPMPTKHALQQARSLIAQEDPRCVDIAVSHGQQFDNVRHMAWFMCAVAEDVKDPLLTPSQLRLLRQLVGSPRGGEYVNPNGSPLKRLKELGFVETRVRMFSGDRAGDWWTPTDAGKDYVKNNG